MSRFINPVPQYFLDDGTVASSGRMKFFVNKDYSTLKDTYSQSDNTIPNTNPVALDGQGRMPPCFGDGLYSVKLYAYDPNQPDNLGALQWTRDDVSLSSVTGQFSDYNPVIPYDLDDVVKAPNGFYYKSIKTPNQGNNPTLSPAFWSKIVFISEYNANETYDDDEIVSYLGRLYASNIANNIGNTPPAAQWDNLTFNNSIAGNFTVSGLITAGSYAGGNLSKTTDTGILKTAKKTTQTTRVSTIALAADPELSISGLEATTFYAIRALIMWDGNGSTVNGISIKINGTSVTYYTVFFLADTNSSAANASPTANQIGGIPSGFNKLPDAASGAEVLIIEAVIQTTLASNIYVEWAQSASNATATRVNVGSYLTAMKL